MPQTFIFFLPGWLLLELLLLLAALFYQSSSKRAGMSKAKIFLLDQLIFPWRKYQKVLLPECCSTRKSRDEQEWKDFQSSSAFVRLVKLITGLKSSFSFALLRLIKTFLKMYNFLSHKLYVIGVRVNKFCVISLSLSLLMQFFKILYNVLGWEGKRKKERKKERKKKKKNKKNKNCMYREVKTQAKIDISYRHS